MVWFVFNELCFPCKSFLYLTKENEFLHRLGIISQRASCCIISLQTICPRKEVQPKRKSQMVKFDPPSQGRRRMRSCGPPQMLGLEAPPWSHPLPNHLPPRFPPIPPSKYRAKTYRCTLKSYTLTMWWIILYTWLLIFQCNVISSLE